MTSTVPSEKTEQEDTAERPARRMEDLLRASRMIRKVKEKIRHDERETIENKVRRWQQLRTPKLPAQILQVSAQGNWAAVFEQEKALLIKTLRELEVVGEVEHIGSTSIPGLAGKPIVDLLIAVEAPILAAERIDALCRAGYTFYGKSPCDPEASWLWKIEPRHAFVAHLCELQNPWIHTAVDFRDYMRTHPDDCTAYEEHKKQLAADSRLNPFEYSMEKLILWYEISARANAWAAEKKRPGPGAHAGTGEA